MYVFIRAFMILALLQNSFAVEVTLNSGWNLFSPIISTATPVDNYLTQLGISGSVSKIWGFDGGWKSWSPSASQMVNLEPNKGYWFLMTEAKTVSLPDSFSNYSMQLSGSGWKLVGLNCSRVVDLNEADFFKPSNFSTGDDTAVRKIWGFSGTWKDWSQGASSNNLVQMTAGQGFWFLMMSDMELASSNINLYDLFPPAVPGGPSISGQ